jgi:phage baseplate assembly protein V
MDQVLARLYRRLMMTVGRGRVTTVDDSGSVQLHQVDLGLMSSNGAPMLVRDKTPALGLFGHASSPPLGADVVVLALGGDQNKLVVIGHGHQASRLKNLETGDAALYDVRGAYFWMTASGPVIDAAGGAVTVRNASSVTVTASGAITFNPGAPGVVINGNLAVSGDVSLGGTAGQAVARVGDAVAGGVITSGAAKVKAV